MTNIDDSDETSMLLQLAETDPADAFSKLISSHIPKVKRSISRRLSSQVKPRVDPSDVAQETQQKAFRQFESYLCRRPMPFRLWLLKTAHERIVEVERMHLRAQRRTVNLELPLPDESSLALLDRVDPSPLHAVVRQEQASIVRQCLAKISSVNREILMLRCFDGLSNADVAVLLELNPETTKKRFSRALLQLKQHLLASGISNDRGAL